RRGQGCGSQRHRRRADPFFHPPIHRGSEEPSHELPHARVLGTRGPAHARPDRGHCALPRSAAEHGVARRALGGRKLMRSIERGCVMRLTRLWVVLAVLNVVPLWHEPYAVADSGNEAGQLREEIRRLREENERSRQRMEELERKVEQLETKDEQKQTELQGTVAKEVEKQASAAPRRYLERYFGENRFVLTGWGAASYEWQRNPNTNTFTATLAPILLYRMTDRVLFEAEPEFELKDDGDTEVNLEYAQADIFLNDYVTAVGGKFLLPFGEFIEQLHPAWINKLVSAPLPFREPEDGGLLPYSNTGFQMRGGAQLFDREGLDIAYNVYIANGPRFDSDEVGALLNPNNIDN